METDFGRNISFDNPEQIRLAQNSALRKHLRYCLRKSPFYRRKLTPYRNDIESITVDGLERLPFTEKTDIEKHNDDLLAVPMARIRDIVMSSGTTGKPTRIMYSENDLRRLAHIEETALRGCGICDSDIVLLSCTMDRCFIAGLAYWLGLKNIGASVVRSGQSTLAGQAVLIDRLAPTVMIGVPSFLMRLGKYLHENGTDPGTTAVKRIVCIGEPLRDRQMRRLAPAKELEKMWAASAFSTYASSETVTAFCECEKQNGGHLIPELAVVEIVDESGNLLPPEEIGEVVVTPLAVDGMPLVRFRTGDISFLMDKGCACGRFSSRLGPIIGRKQQMMKVRGTTIYPQAVYTLLEEIGAVDEFFITVQKAPNGTDSVAVSVALCDTSLAADKIRDRLQAELRVSPAVEVLPIDSVRRVVFNPESRKPVRFFDQRK